MLESEDPSRTGPLVSQSHEKDIMSPYTLKDDRCCSRFGRGAKRQWNTRSWSLSTYILIRSLGPSAAHRETSHKALVGHCDKFLGTIRNSSAYNTDSSLSQFNYFECVIGESSFFLDFNGKLLHHGGNISAGTDHQQCPGQCWSGHLRMRTLNAINRSVLLTWAAQYEYVSSYGDELCAIWHYDDSQKPNHAHACSSTKRSSYTASLTTSALDYRHENGRCYHGFRDGCRAWPLFAWPPDQDP